jgi:putative cell wall-binding protein
MKKIASILLFVFVAFLITPAVISAIENDADISVVSNFSEEEQLHKDIKLVFYYNQVFSSVPSSNVVSKTILTENSLKHDDISLGIFIPPPELI